MSRDQAKFYICGPFEFRWTVFTGRALKFRIFFWSKLNLGERSKTGPGRPFAESAKELLTNLKPQLVSACAVELPTIVYTDAAFENDLATWGRCYLIGWASIGWFIGGVSPVIPWQCAAGTQFILNRACGCIAGKATLRWHPPESSFIVLHRHHDVSSCARSVFTWCFETLRCFVWESAKRLKYCWPATWREWRSCSYDRSTSEVIDWFLQKSCLLAWWFVQLKTEKWACKLTKHAYKYSNSIDAACIWFWYWPWSNVWSKIRRQ